MNVLDESQMANVPPQGTVQVMTGGQMMSSTDGQNAPHGIAVSGYFPTDSYRNFTVESDGTGNFKLRNVSQNKYIADDNEESFDVVYDADNGNIFDNRQRKSNVPGEIGEALFLVPTGSEQGGQSYSLAEQDGKRPINTDRERMMHFRCYSIPQI